MEKNHEFTRIALEKLEKIRCITSLKKLFHGVLFKSNVPRCKIFSSFPLSSHEPPAVEDETVLIAVRMRSSPEVELEFACQPHAVRKIQMADFFGGKEKDPQYYKKLLTLLRFFEVRSFRCSPNSSCCPCALYKNLQKNPPWLERSFLF